MQELPAAAVAAAAGGFLLRQRSPRFIVVGRIGCGRHKVEWVSTCIDRVADTQTFVGPAGQFYNGIMWVLFTRVVVRAHVMR